MRACSQLPASPRDSELISPLSWWARFVALHDAHRCDCCCAPFLSSLRSHSLCRYIFECKSAKEARNYFLNGMKKRLVASHKMNASSSRSHCIFTIYLEQKPEHDPEQIITAKLSLVDLVRSTGMKH